MGKYKGKMLAVFHQIWTDRVIEDESGEYVVCVECGKRIYKSFVTHWNFSHIKSKQSHPDLALDPSNIEIQCMKCHTKHHGLNLKTHNFN